MASLNTLRTKFGIVLSIIIALALLAFILSLKTEMGFSGNDPRVGVIDGKKINYSEYYDQYEQIKQQNNVQENDEQQSAMLANAVWQTLIAKYVMTPGFDRMDALAGFLQCFRRSPHGSLRRSGRQPVPRACRDQSPGRRRLGADQRTGPSGT